MKLFEDTIDKKFRDRVLNAADAEIEKQHAPVKRRFFFAQMAATLGAVVVGLVIVEKRRSANTTIVATENQPDLDPQMLGELAIVQDLEFWQNLEVLENAKELDEDT